MAKPDIRLSIRTSVPDITAAAEFFPGTSPVRPTIAEYAEGLDRRGRLTPVVREAVEKAEAMRSRTQGIVYVAGGLTGVSEAMKDRYGRVSDLLSSYPKIPNGKDSFFGYVPHLHGTDPVKHPDVTPQEVRDVDFLWSSVAGDMHVNFLVPMAHGNAIEEGWSERGMIPTVYMNEAGNRLSRLTKGMDNVMRTIDYDTFEEQPDFQNLVKDPERGWQIIPYPGMTQLRHTFDEVHTWMRTFPDRDPREFHYLSFATMAEPLARQTGLDMSEGVPPVFGRENLLAYLKYPDYDRYGQVGKITWVAPEYGITVDFGDGDPQFFDVMQAPTSLSLWPK